MNCACGGRVVKVAGKCRLICLGCGVECALLPGQGVKPVVPTVPAVAKPKAREPNATEREALRVLGFDAAECLYEPRSFAVAGGHTYTPDWGCRRGPHMTYIEVKGEHIHSRDSRIMFDCSRAAYPEHTWVWARKRTKGRKGKRWEVEVYG